jgi:hypothetical protein
MKILRSLNLLDPKGPVQAYTGIALSSLLLLPVPRIERQFLGLSDPV